VSGFPRGFWPEVAPAVRGRLPTDSTADTTVGLVVGLIGAAPTPEPRSFGRCSGGHTELQVAQETEKELSAVRQGKARATLWRQRGTTRLKTQDVDKLLRTEQNPGGSYPPLRETLSRSESHQATQDKQNNAEKDNKQQQITTTNNNAAQTPVPPGQRPSTSPAPRGS